MNQGRFRIFCLWLADAICIVTVWTVVVLCYKAAGFGQYDVQAYLRAWPTYPSLPLPPAEEFRRLVLSALATHLLIMAILGFSHRATDISRVVLAAASFPRSWRSRPRVRPVRAAALPNIHAWRSPQAQIDLLIDRDDGIINLCEMKFASDDFEITVGEDRNMKRKIAELKKLSGTRKSIHVTYVTTYGLRENSYAKEVQSEVTLDDLFWSE